jgi:hypothetical protein
VVGTDIGDSPGSGSVYAAIRAEARMITVDLVDRLLASRLVPHDAKFAAVESWRHELASTPGKDCDDPQLERRLTEASRRLRLLD